MFLICETECGWDHTYIRTADAEGCWNRHGTAGTVTKNRWALSGHVIAQRHAPVALLGQLAFVAVRLIFSVLIRQGDSNCGDSANRWPNDFKITIQFHDRNADTEKHAMRYAITWKFWVVVCYLRASCVCIEVWMCVRWYMNMKCVLRRGR